MGKTRKNRKFAKASKIDPTNSKSYTSENEFVQGDEIGEDLLQKIANNLKSGRLCQEYKINEIDLCSEKLSINMSTNLKLLFYYISFEH